jgi:hypothetical protein
VMDAAHGCPAWKPGEEPGLSCRGSGSAGLPGCRPRRPAGWS